ncbi:MAG: GerMN domain-containing protein [Lachnospiraceae bacterium]|nr:GerMN domain-containing protein [Lachnospiraceae bacterium]
MKKNKKATALLSLVILCGLAACGNATQEAEAAVIEVTADAPVNEETEEAVQTDVMIYYGNGASDNLDMEISTMEQVTADNLIDALAKHNIVSIGTKVNSFDEEDNNGVKTLHLDLSKTFHEYLKTMTEEGENIIMCSVAATFLKAYDADEIAITVEGDVLQTDHATYEEPLRFKAEQLTAPVNE